MTEASNQSGYSIVETLVGSVLVVLASLALVAIVMHMSAQNQKAQTQSRSLALQSQIITALTRDDTFAKSASYYTTMNTASSDPSAGQTTIDGVPLVNKAGQTIAISGQRIGLDSQFAPCDPTSAACPLRVDLALRCSGSVGCQSAYRVSVAPNTNAPAIPALGAPVRQTAGAHP